MATELICIIQVQTSPGMKILMAPFFALEPRKAAVLISECECRPDAGLSASVNQPAPSPPVGAKSEQCQAIFPFPPAFRAVEVLMVVYYL